MTKSRESARSDSVTGANDDLPGPAGERLGYSPFPIVGIGASAGGLEAFKQLLSLLPADTGMAFVLIQHLAPNSESRLTELLAKATQLPVVEAADQMTVAPDHVYVIPGNTTLTLEHGLLRVAPRVENRPHLPIDVFFRSLAEDSQARAIGVISSTRPSTSTTSSGTRRRWTRSTGTC